MMVVKQVLGHHVTLSGESHSGWLPENAALPKPNPSREVALNITIEHDGAGYVLCWVSSDGAIAGDLWYQTLNDAEATAAEDFGVAADQWQTLA
jgi:hypothetical protein